MQKSVGTYGSPKLAATFELSQQQKLYVKVVSIDSNAPNGVFITKDTEFGAGLPFRKERSYVADVT